VYIIRASLFLSMRLASIKKALEKTKSERFAALHIFTGLTVFLTIIGNTQCGGAIPYQQLIYSGWNGCKLTDLVFPSLLFAVGNAIEYVPFAC